MEIKYNKNISFFENTSKDFSKISTDQLKKLNSQENFNEYFNSLHDSVKQSIDEVKEDYIKDFLIKILKNNEIASGKYGNRRSLSELKEGDIFCGNSTRACEEHLPTDIYEVTSIRENYGDKSVSISFKSLTSDSKFSFSHTITIPKTGLKKMLSRRSVKQDEIENLKKKITQKYDEQFEKDFKEQFNRMKEELENELIKRDKEEMQVNKIIPQLIEIGQKNFWLVGPAGCGKSTIVRDIAKELNLPYLCISCGIGTSSTEFLGYKYPERKSTRFSEYYSKPSIILLDEITALDASVGQILNAALANDEIETTTGIVKRNEKCIIIATSNTFGSGASRQYVANNQLDSSTIDRFVGGIFKVDYSLDYEIRYDEEVVSYILDLRECIETNGMRKVASTRMIQAGERLKKISPLAWKDILISNWSESEKEILDSFLNKKSLDDKKLKYQMNKTIEFAKKDEAA